MVYVREQISRLKWNRKPHNGWVLAIVGGNIKRANWGSEGKLNVGEDEKQFTIFTGKSHENPEGDNGEASSRKISDTQRAFLARAGGEITLIKKSEERKNPICPLEYYSTELKLSGAGDGLSSS